MADEEERGLTPPNIRTRGLQFEGGVSSSVVKTLSPNRAGGYFRDSRSYIYKHDVPIKWELLVW
jgi:hypothetical protein